MTSITINKKNEVEGHFSFEVSTDKTSKPNIVSIKGVLETCGYLPEISSIENERYRLEKVSVYTESFGSDEDKVAYLFTAGRFDIKKCWSDGNDG